jgi:hypothetical protein
VALDVEETIAQIAGERDRRLADVESRLAQARQVQREAMRQQERLDGLLREGLTLDEWRRLSEVPERDAANAALSRQDLTAEREEIEASVDLVDATGEFMQRTPPSVLRSPGRSPRPRTSPPRESRSGECSMASSCIGRTHPQLHAA